MTGRLPRILNVTHCASDKPFLVVFQKERSQDWTLQGDGYIAVPAYVAIDVDGQRLGGINRLIDTVCRYLCEGNHQAGITVTIEPDPRNTEVYLADFAASGPSFL